MLVTAPPAGASTVALKFVLAPLVERRDRRPEHGPTGIGRAAARRADKGHIRRQAVGHNHACRGGRSGIWHDGQGVDNVIGGVDQSADRLLVTLKSRLGVDQRDHQGARIVAGRRVGDRSCRPPPCWSPHRRPEPAPSHSGSCSHHWSGSGSPASRPPRWHWSVPPPVAADEGLIRGLRVGHDHTGRGGGSGVGDGQGVDNVIGGVDCRRTNLGHAQVGLGVDQRDRTPGHSVLLPGVGSGIGLPTTAVLVTAPPAGASTVTLRFVLAPLVRLGIVGQ